MSGIYRARNMSSLGFLVDMLPWLHDLSAAARDFPLSLPVAVGNQDRGTKLVREIGEFVAHWNHLAPSKDVTPVATAVANAGTPSSPAVQRRADATPVTTDGAPALTSSSPPVQQRVDGTPVTTGGAHATTPSSTAIKRRKNAKKRKSDERGRKRLREENAEAPRSEGTQPEASNAEDSGGVPRGSKTYWNTKLATVFSKASKLIPGALGNYVASLSSEEQCAVREKILRRPEDRVGNILVRSLRASFQAVSTSRCKEILDIRMAGAAMAFGGPEESVGEIASVLGIRSPVVNTGMIGHSNLLAGAGFGMEHRRRSGLLVGLVRTNINLPNQVVSAEIEKKIRAFWLSDGITRVSTSKRDVLTLRHADGTVEKAPKQWLEMTQLEVYRKFMKKEPGLKIGLRTFEQKKPKQVRRLTRHDTISCCCRYHEEMRLAVTGYHRAHEVLHSNCDCGDRVCCPLVGGQRAVMSNRKPTLAFPDKVCGRVEVGCSTSSFTAAQICPKPTLDNGEPAEFHDLACLDGSCGNCSGLQNMTLCASEISKQLPLVEWSTYENALLGQDANGKNKYRVQYVQKRTPVGELVAKLQAVLLGHVPGDSANCTCSGSFAQKTEQGSWELMQLEGVAALDGVGGRACPFLKPYAYHCFMAQHSMKMFNMCKANLPLGHVCLLFDYSENHSLNIPRAIQSLHWVCKQATLLCCVLWRHATLEVDGVESTEANPVIVKDLIYLISDTMPHSHRGIQHMRKLIVSEYFVKRGIPLPIFIHEWADGCGGQNKCATAFADVVESGRTTEWVRGLGIPCQRNFFETSHARGEQDAMGVAVKHEASLAVMSTTDKWYGKILTAKDLYEFCMERLQFAKDQGSNRRSAFGQRFFFLVEGDDVDTSGPEFDTVDGTLALHSIRAGVGLLVGLKRERQCYCEYCYEQCTRAEPDCEGCHYASHVDSWVPFTLKAKTQAQARQTRMAAAELAHDTGVLVARGNIFARPSGGDELHPYYLVKALSGVQEVRDEGGWRDDYYTPSGSGVLAAFGDQVIEGRFLEWLDEGTCTEYYIDSAKKCLTYSHHVVCAEVSVTKRRIKGQDIFRVSDEEHERILSLLY